MPLTGPRPGGRLFAWAYGSGESGHPWINLCATTCVKGALPPTPGWILLGEIALRDQHQLLLKSWEQPDGHELSLSAIVLSTFADRPDWQPCCRGQTGRTAAKPTGRVVGTAAGSQAPGRTPFG